MISTTVRVVNRLGLHARAAAKVVRVAAQYSAEVALSREGPGPERDAKSILALLMLGAAQGTLLVLSADGSDEAEALGAVCRVFAEKFGEEA
jgi:phosphotransferase system HPr (HPr) family protein